MNSLPPWAVEAIDYLASALAAKIQKKPENYTSRNKPQNITTRKFNAACRRIDGATRCGHIWTVPVAVWDEHHRVLPKTKGGDELAELRANSLRKAGNQ
jgi:hypothetical protein